MLPNVLQTSATDHVPVLADEVRELLAVQPGETVVDATFGAGGHATLLAADLQGRGKLIAIDRDPARAMYFDRFAKRAGVQTRFLRGDFSVVLEQLAAQRRRGGRDPARPRRLVDADRPARARLLVHGRRAARHAHGSVGGRDRRAASSTRRPSGSWRRSSSATARSATRGRSRRAIVRRRKEQPFERTGDLVETIKAAIPAPARFGDGHPAKRVFQALRIAVNDELGSLEAALPAGVRDAAPRRAARRDQLPLARGPDRQALPARPRARLHVPAGLPGLRLRQRAAAARRLARRPIRPSAPRARREPARRLGAPARGASRREHSDVGRLESTPAPARAEHPCDRAPSRRPRPSRAARGRASVASPAGSLDRRDRRAARRRRRDERGRAAPEHAARPARARARGPESADRGARVAAVERGVRAAHPAARARAARPRPGDPDRDALRALRR